MVCPIPKPYWFIFLNSATSADCLVAIDTVITPFPRAPNIVISHCDGSPCNIVMVVYLSEASGYL